MTFGLPGGGWGKSIARRIPSAAVCSKDVSSEDLGSGLNERRHSASGTEMSSQKGRCSNFEVGAVETFGVGNIEGTSGSLPRTLPI